MKRMIFVALILITFGFMPSFLGGAHAQAQQCCPVDSCFDISDSVWTDSCCVLSGDVNNSGSVNGLDVTYFQNYLRGGAFPIPEVHCSGYPSGTYYMSADANGNCTANGIDLTYLVYYLSNGSPAPRCCEDASGCVAYYP